MRTSHFLAFFLFAVPGFIFSQNLVTNGSFETLSTCPDSYNQVSRATRWYPSYDNNVSPYHCELLNSCNTGLFGVPSSTWGNQSAYSGQGYVVIAMQAPSISVDYRENAYCQLSNSLIVGNTYDVSFKVSLADNCQYSSDKMGVKFSTNTKFEINNISQVYFDTVVTSNSLWKVISGSFVADSAYNYIAIGNFFKDVNTTTILSYPSSPYGYPAYFFDDIQVTPNAAKSVGENHKTSAFVSNYITPDGDGKNDFAIVKNLPENFSGSVKIYDTVGKLIYQKESFSEILWNGKNMDATPVPVGIYFFNISGGDFQKSGKIGVF